MLWSDAVYVPDFARLDRHVVLVAHDQRRATSYAGRYFERLTTPQ